MFGFNQVSLNLNRMTKEARYDSKAPLFATRNARIL